MKMGYFELIGKRFKDLNTEEQKQITDRIIKINDEKEKMIKNINIFLNEVSSGNEVSEDATWEFIVNLSRVRRVIRIIDEDYLEIIKSSLSVDNVRENFDNLLTKIFDVVQTKITIDLTKKIKIFKDNVSQYLNSFEGGYDVFMSYGRKVISDYIIIKEVISEIFMGIEPSAIYHFIRAEYIINHFFHFYEPLAEYIETFKNNPVYDPEISMIDEWWIFHKPFKNHCGELSEYIGYDNNTLDINSKIVVERHLDTCKKCQIILEYVKENSDKFVNMDPNSNKKPIVYH